MYFVYRSDRNHLRHLKKKTGWAEGRCCRSATVKEAACRVLRVSTYPVPRGCVLLIRPLPCIRRAGEMHREHLSFICLLVPQTAILIPDPRNVCWLSQPPESTRARNARISFLLPNNHEAEGRVDRSLNECHVSLFSKRKENCPDKIGYVMRPLPTGSGKTIVFLA